jgi:hypothetical protein
LLSIYLLLLPFVVIGKEKEKEEEEVEVIEKINI